MVIYVLTDSASKAAIVERFNRTLRERIGRYMTENSTKRWIDYLPEAIENYNNTYHSSIGMIPNLVSFQNRAEVFKKLYPDIDLKVKCKLKVGWRVRIPTKKSIFEKGFTPNWSKTIYIISKTEQVLFSCLVWYFKCLFRIMVFVFIQYQTRRATSYRKNGIRRNSTSFHDEVL